MRRACLDALRTTQGIGSRRAYSAHRVFAFHEYCESVSRTRVFLVLLLYCAPSIVLVTLLDCIPLQDPTAGWRVNVTFWARTCVGALVICGAILVQAQLVIPDVPFTLPKIAVIAVGTAVGHTAVFMFIAENWMFPVPFSFTTGGIPIVIIMNSLVVITLKLTDGKLFMRYFRYVSGVGLQTVMMVVYPAYNALFLSLGAKSQLAFVLVLPVIKLSFKYLIAKMHAHDEDLVPAMSSTVDIFDALYMTKCMQSAGTLVVGFAIIAVDLVLNVVAITSLGTRTRRIREILAAERGSGNAQALKGLLPWVFHLLDRTRRSSFQAIDMGLSSRYKLSVHSRTILSSIQFDGEQEGAAAIAPDETYSSRKVVPLDHVSLHTLTSVAPGNPDPIPEAASLYGLKQCARMLHESESVAVVEYIETVVPVVYALYLTILFYLPNAKYYQDMREFTEPKLWSVVNNILVYGFLELLSLIHVHRSLSRQFGISMFYQLAFALENEAKIFQCNFFSWILVVFQFLLIHCVRLERASTRGVVTSGDSSQPKPEVVDHESRGTPSPKIVASGSFSLLPFKKGFACSHFKLCTTGSDAKWRKHFNIDKFETANRKLGGEVMTDGKAVNILMRVLTPKAERRTLVRFGDWSNQDTRGVVKKFCTLAQREQRASRSTHGAGS